MPDIITGKGGDDFEKIPPGSHVAICTTVVNMGIQPAGQYAPRNKHWIAFEVPSHRVKWKKDGIEHEGPGIIGNSYSSSLHSKAILRQHLESWRGVAFTQEQIDGFDIQSILGKPCMISVTHSTDGKWANIAGIMGVPSGMTVPPQEGPILKYSPSDPTSVSDLLKLPDWLQKKINEGYRGGLKLPDYLQKTINEGSGDIYKPQAESENPAPAQQPYGTYTSEDTVAADQFDDDIPF